MMVGLAQQLTLNRCIKLIFRQTQHISRSFNYQCITIFRHLHILLYEVNWLCLFNPSIITNSIIFKSFNFSIVPIVISSLSGRAGCSLLAFSSCFLKLFNTHHIVTCTQPFTDITLRLTGRNSFYFNLQLHLCLNGEYSYFFNGDLPLD